MKTNSIVKIMALGIVLVLGIFFVKNMSATTNSPTAAVTSQFEGRADIQEFKLSFGETNYVPDVINVKSNKPVRIIADTDKVKGCFAALKIPELKVAKTLTPNDNVLEFMPEKPGEYAFGCSMGMGNGKIIVT